MFNESLTFKELSSLIGVAEWKVRLLVWHTNRRARRARMAPVFLVTRMSRFDPNPLVNISRGHINAMVSSAINA